MYGSHVKFKKETMKAVAETNLECIMMYEASKRKKCIYLQRLLNSLYFR